MRVFEGISIVGSDGGTLDLVRAWGREKHLSKFNHTMEEDMSDDPVTKASWGMVPN